MIRHVAGIAEIVEDVEKAAEFYRALGLNVKVDPGHAMVEVPGVMYFGLWGRAEAAESTFGSRDAADRVPLGFTIGFEVDSVDEDASLIPGETVNDAKDEPWGQRTIRFLSPTGALCELAETSWARELETNVSAKATQPKS